MIKPVFYRNPHNYDLKEASDAAAIPPDQMGESLTIQSQAEDADINVMIGRFLHTGVMPQGTRIPEYGDFTGISDYRSALHSVLDAQDNFLQLDPKLRARFNNDPQEFLTFASDPNNIDELRKLGLAKEKAIEHDKGSTGGTGETSGGRSSTTGGSAS